MNMIKKLQRKFIMIAGLAVVIIMFCLLAPINLLNRYKVSRELEKTLSYIIEAGGELSATQETEIEVNGDTSWVRLLNSFVGENGSLNFTPESKYQLRYFLVTLDEEGEVEDVNLSHIASVNEQEALKMTEHARSRHLKKGFLEEESSSYYYLKVKRDDGTSVIGFMECTREINNLSVFYYSSMGFAFLLVVVFLILIAVLSKRIMQPYVDNIESQREFITNAGHELKTPLAIISANTEVIEMINGKSEWTDSIIAQVKRETTLINDMITLSRMSEAEQIVLIDIDISKTLTESAQSFRPVIEQQGKKLVMQIQEGLSVKADQKVLTELCNILIDNASKYCDEHGTVQVALKKKGRSAVMMQVSNDYKDGADTDYSKFFRRFYRGDVSHNSQKSGYGIGLSMAQTITEKLKGKISASWKNGVITFTVVL